MKFRDLCAAALISLAGVGAAQSSVVSATGAGVIIDAPAQMLNASPGSNTSIFAFNELQGYTLTKDLATDQGLIAAGTKISSHMIFFNQLGKTAKVLSASFAFSGQILGTMSDQHGLLLKASDFLGGPTFYEHFKSRGLEGPDRFSILGNEIDVWLQVKRPGDWIRVITTYTAPVPVALPAAGFLLPGALAGLGLFRRRRRAA